MPFNLIDQPGFNIDCTGVDPNLSKIAIMIGYGSGTLLAAAITGSSLAGLLGLGILITPFVNLTGAMSAILNEHSNIFYASQFFLSAATAMLAGFVGLALVSLFTAALGNPFTLPAIIGAGVSAAIILGVGTFVCQQFKTTQGMSQFLIDLFNPVAAFSPDSVNDRLKDIIALGQEDSFEDRGIVLS